MVNTLKLMKVPNLDTCDSEEYNIFMLYHLQV